jgi:hypothetical protein
MHMTRKRLILFGTRHWKTTDIPREIRDSLEVLIREFQPDIALEEWSATQTEKSGLVEVCGSMDLPWESIGTPPEPRYKTCDYRDAADFPNGANVTQYGPLPAQEVREEAMCGNIVRAMSARNVALVVVGLAHLHSMLAKLSKNFDVKGYAYRLEIF